jgi:hypothetical protein
VIRYALTCPDRHAFEAWFSGSGAFEDQQARGLLACPVCGSTAVDRAVMAPAVATGRSAERRESREITPTDDAAEPPVRLAANVPDGPAAEKHEVVAALRKLRQHLTENAENVGRRFAEEARRIHYNEVEKRAIYGEATREDAKGLAEEGIEFHPLPPLPEDHN